MGQDHRWHFQSMAKCAGHRPAPAAPSLRLPTTANARSAQAMWPVTSERCSRERACFLTERLGEEFVFGVLRSMRAGTGAPATLGAIPGAHPLAVRSMRAGTGAPATPLTPLWARGRRIYDIVNHLTWSFAAGVGSHVLSCQGSLEVRSQRIHGSSSSRMPCVPSRWRDPAIVP